MVRQKRIDHGAKLGDYLLAENTILLQKGERLDTVFFGISGKVKAYLTDKQGGEITVATLKSGDTFAETVLCCDQYAGVSMKSLEPTSLLLFSKEYFNRLRDVYPELSTALLHCLANKLRMGYENLAGASEWEQDLRGYISRRDAPCLPELLGQTPLINKLLLGPNTLQIPPLRKRKGDLLLLVDFLIIKECFKGAHRKIIQGISPASYRRIMEYDWPGNMEELEIVIRRAINLTKSEHLMPDAVTSFFVPVIIASQLVRGGEDAARSLLPPDRPELAWPLFGAFLLLASGGAFALVRLGGHVTFPELKDSTIKKHHLFSHGLIPLLFVYELAFQLGPLLERLGHIPTVLGNQVGINLKFLEFGLSRAGVLPLQELSLLAGTMTSVVFTTLLARKHCREAYRPSLLRYMPLILLGLLYMWIFT